MAGIITRAIDRALKEQLGRGSCQAERAVQAAKGRARLARAATRPRSTKIWQQRFRQMRTGQAPADWCDLLADLNRELPTQG